MIKKSGSAPTADSPVACGVGRPYGATCAPCASAVGSSLLSSKISCCILFLLFFCLDLSTLSFATRSSLCTRNNSRLLLLILFLCSDGTRRVVLLCGDRNAFTSRAIPKALSNEIGKRHPSCDLCVA